MKQSSALLQVEGHTARLAVINSHGDIHTKMEQAKEGTRIESNDKDKTKEEDEARHQGAGSTHLIWFVYVSYSVNFKDSSSYH